MNKKNELEQVSGIFTPETRNEIPESAGVYLYKDEQGTILYIGKAKNLRKRVSSYFVKSPIYLKTHLLVQSIHTIDIIMVHNENEALFLEAHLIKKHLPRFNINFKDGKFYPYIKITTGEEFPRMFITRNKYKDNHLYFGPYASAGNVRATLEVLQKMFQIRTCKTLPKKACLEYHMKRCSAPCIQNISEQEYLKQIDMAIQFLSGNKQELISQLESQMKEAAKERLFEKAQIYKEQLDSIIALEQKQHVYLNSESDVDIVAVVERDNHVCVVISLIRQGKLSGKESYILKADFSIQLSLKDIFEEFLISHYSSSEVIPKSVIVHEQFENICTDVQDWLAEDDIHIQFKIVDPSEYQEISLLSLAEKNAFMHLEQSISQIDYLALLQQVQDSLQLKNFPTTIEGFDIAKLDGTLASGVCVQFQGGEPHKSAYRMYNIRHENQQDDYAGMEEMIYRHYSKLLKENKALPQLIVIDGGKGQLKSALSALEQLKIQDIDIISIAKQEEEIFKPHQKIGTLLPDNSPILHLLQRVRDESHRFSQHQLHRRMDKKMKE